LNNEVSCRVTAALIKYLENQGFDSAELYSGLPYNREFLLQVAHWIPEPGLNTLVDRAISMTHQEDLMFEVGCSDPVILANPVTKQLIKQFSTPRLAFSRIGQFGIQFSHNIRFQVDMIDDDCALIRLSQTKTGPPSRFACRYARGVLSRIPRLWDLPPAEIKELSCSQESGSGLHFQAAEDSRDCLFEIRWQNPINLITKFHDRLFRRQMGQHNTIEVLEKYFTLLNAKNKQLLHQNALLASVRQIAVAMDSKDTTTRILQKIVELCRDIPGVGFALLAHIDAAENRVSVSNYSKIRNPAIISGLKALGMDVESDPDTLLANHLCLSPSEMKVIIHQTRSHNILAYDRLSHLLGGVWPEKLCDDVQKLTGFRRYVLLPLSMDENNWFGLILSLSEDIPPDILEMLKSHTTIALKNARTLEKLSRRNQELSAVNAIAVKIAQSLDIDQIIDQTIQEVIAIYHVQSASIHLLDEKSSGMRLVGQQGMPEQIQRDFQYLPSDHSFCQILSSSENLISAKMPELPNKQGLVDLFGKADVPIWFMTSVIVLDGKRKGALTVVRSGSEGFQEDEKELLISISNHLAIAFQNAHLHHNLLQRIEELERTQNELSESDEKMRLTLDALFEAILVVGLNGRITQANKAAVWMYGYERNQEMIGQSALKFVVWDERRRMLENLKKIKETGVFKKAEYCLMKMDGSSFDSECSISLFRSFLGHPAGFVICVRDVTFRKQTEKRLIENERRYRLITEHTNDFIALLTFGGYYSYVSPSYRQLGYEPTELINKSGLDLIHPDDRKVVLPLLLKYSQIDTADLARSKKESASQHLDYRVKDKAGNWHQFAATGTIIENQDGHGFVFLLISRDVTQQKKADDELQALYAREKSTSQALAQEISKRADFFRALVHELKTPLTPILVSSETLKDLAPDQTYQNLASNVYHSAMRLNNRIDELLDISRGEMGLLKLNWDPVDIGLLLKDIIRFVQPQITQNGQFLISQIQDNLPPIKGDEMRVRQIIQNLLDNAMKFTPDNGQIYLEALADNDNLMVKIRDTGRGIDDYDKERIFQPYNRIESDRQHFSGLGLGLALCKQLVDLHGGKLWIETHKNQGTIFFFTLPVYKTSPALPQNSAALEANRQKAD
jgi:PAS domain S-box-containing protein